MYILAVPTIVRIYKRALLPTRPITPNIVHGYRQTALEAEITPALVVHVVMGTTHQFADGDGGVDVEIVVANSSSLVKEESFLLPADDVTITVHYVELWEIFDYLLKLFFPHFCLIGSPLSAQFLYFITITLSIIMYFTTYENQT